jgi:hypothetical protein
MVDGMGDTNPAADLSNAETELKKSIKLDVTNDDVVLGSLVYRSLPKAG